MSLNALIQRLQHRQHGQPAPEPVHTGLTGVNKVTLEVRTAGPNIHAGFGHLFAPVTPFTPVLLLGREKFAENTAPTASQRPYKLSAGEAAEAHAEPWNEADIGRFTRRLSRALQLGFAGDDADDLAERLHLRAVRQDPLGCLACIHLAGSVATRLRCGNHRAAGVARDLPVDLAVMLQRCPGFMPLWGES